MKILFVARSTPFHRSGGMEIQSWAIVEELAARGHEMVVLTTQLSANSKAETPPRVTLVTAFSLRKGEYSLLWYLNIIRYWLAHRKEGWDVIFSVSTAAAPLTLVHRKMQPPIVMQLHGTAVGELRTKLRTRSLGAKVKAIRNVLWILRDAITFPRVDAFITVGEAVHQQVLQWPTSSFLAGKLPTRIENGVDTTLFFPGPRIRRRVLMLSRLVKEKGTELAIQIFAKALSIDKELTLLIVGDGPERGAMTRECARRELSGSVQFAGRLDRSATAAAIRESSVLLFPTLRDEGLPLNILECLASGVPVVTTDRIAHTLAPEDVVVRFDPRDVEGMASCLARIAAREGESACLLGDAHKLSFSVDGYERLLTELSEQGHAASS